MRFVYNLILHLLSPLLLWVAYRHAHKHPQFRLPDCWQKRRGINGHLKRGGLLMHAVSAGETRVALLLLQRLSKIYPNLPLILTSGSLNGAEQINLCKADIGLQSTMMPLDYPLYIRRFMRQAQPRVLVIMETELWPNLYAYCHQHQIKILLLNTRISDKSYRLYQYFSFAKTLLKYVDWIGVQAATDKEKITHLGVKEEKITVLGNLKSLSMMSTNDLSEGVAGEACGWQTWRQNQGHGFCWVAGSVHQDEVAIVLQAHVQFKQQDTHALLILAPRQPIEFEQIRAMVNTFCRQYGWQYRQHSDGIVQSPDDTLDVLIVDKMGILSDLYRIADAAFVGGSLMPHGGHNIFEPAVFTIPIISGPYHYDQQALYTVFMANQAILICHGADQLTQALVKTQDKDFRVQLEKNIRKSRQQMQAQAEYQFNQVHIKLKEILAYAPH